MHDNDKQLGEKIARARKEAGLSQTDLSKEIYVTRQALSNWERGRTRPRQESVEKIAGVLGVTAEYLLGVPLYAADEGETETERREEEWMQEKRMSTRHIMIGLGYAISLCLGLTVFFVVGLLAMQPMVWAAALFGGVGIFLCLGMTIHFLVLWKRPE